MQNEKNPPKCNKLAKFISLISNNKIPNWKNIQLEILLWIKNHKDNNNKILERQTVKVAFKDFIKFLKSKNLKSENIGNKEMHEIFATQIDNF